MTSLLDQIAFNTAPGPNYESENEDNLLPTRIPTRVIAYYLPQFHPIPENDTWWGKGFTEWRNVTKGLPRYKGHLQPRLPEALGFYDLRLKDIMRQQADLAKKYGVHGFCFYYYWFGGKRLLEGPLETLLSDPSIDLPFCLCWANESWSRTWTSQERDILIEQKYSDQGDIRFADDLQVIVSDTRYIKVNDRPLVMLYRPQHLPDAAKTVARWRKRFAELGLPDPYVVMPQAFETDDPRPFGIDAAVGFPPHKVGFNLPNIRTEQEILDPHFLGRVCDYDHMVEAATGLDPSDYKLFPGVCPSWDNEARRPGRGVSFKGATPAKYGAWLTTACRKAMAQPDPEERIVFVNAWNEWAEGACLEPDCHHGYAYLRETARALSRAGGEDTTGKLVSPAPAPAQSATKISFDRTVRRVRWKVASLVDWLSEVIRP